MRRALRQLEQQRWQSSVPAPAVEMPQMPAYDYTPPPYTGPSKDKVLSLRKQFLSPGTVPADSGSALQLASTRPRSHVPPLQGPRHDHRRQDAVPLR